VRAVRKFQAGGIHALFDQPNQCVQMVAGRPDRTDDFCFTHLSSSGIDKRSIEVQKMPQEPVIRAYDSAVWHTKRGSMQIITNQLDFVTIEGLLAYGDDFAKRTPGVDVEAPAPPPSTGDRIKLAHGAMDR